MITQVTQNPFRILGVYANSATKDIVANEGKMKAFLKVGRDVSYPLDLPSILPAVQRSEAIVANAKSKIALPDDKLKHAQFWFVKSTPIDDVAFNHLFQGDFDGAVETFKKKRTASSLQNLVVCYLIKQNYLLAAQTASSLYADFTEDFVNAIDPQASAAKQTLINQFVNGLLASGVDVKPLKSSLTDSDWVSAIDSMISKPLVDNLKKALETAKAARGNGCNARLEAGKRLMAAVKIDLPKLKGVLDSLQYQVLADELANEILQCGIDYFNDSEDDDAPHKAMTIQKYASTIAVGSVTKDRCKENVDILQKIINNLPPKEVAVEAKAINKELEKFCKLPDEISHSVNLLNATKPHLQAIKAKLGASNTFYLKISTQVVGNALHNVIEEVNASQRKFSAYMKAVKDSGLDPQLLNYLNDELSPVKVIETQVKPVLRAAWKATTLMDTFDMESEFKTNRYNPNRSSLRQMCSDLGISTYGSSATSSTRTTTRMTPRTSSSASTSRAYGSSSGSTPRSSSGSSSDDTNWGCIIAVIIGIIIFLANMCN